MENLNRIKFSKGKIEGIVQIFTYKDDDDNIYYSECPALDIVSYGDTEEEAQKMLEEAIEIQLDYMNKKGTLIEELLKLGWKKNPYNKQKFENKVFTDKIPPYLMSKNPNIRNQKVFA